MTRALFEDNDRIIGIPTSRPGEQDSALLKFADRLAPLLSKVNLELTQTRPFDWTARSTGRDWPARAETMVGLQRLANARFCIESVLADGVPGDLIETGVWRGGMSIFMKGVLKAHGDNERTVWLADSFQGLPPPDPARFPADRQLDLTGHDILSVGVEEVRHNFERYGLMDDRVQFIIGWFRETLPTAPINELAVLRLDGDLYESTLEALEPLYPKLAPGGYCIIDDFGTVPPCAAAVTDYRRAHDIDAEIIDIDGAGVYWRKPRCTDQ